MPDPVIESREFARVECRLAAVIEGKCDIDDGIVENIGLSGLYMCLHDNPSIQNSERVKIDIYNLKKSQHSVVTLHARVVRIDSRGLAVQFLPMELSDYLKLEDLVDLLSIQAAKKKIKSISSMLIGRIHSKFGVMNKS